MTEHTAADYGDPTEWDEIPDEWTQAFTAAIEAHGHTVTDAHEAAIFLDVPGLNDGHAWYLGKPTFHGMWCYGVADERGYCPNPTWLDVDATDPRAVADVVHAVLADAPLHRHWAAGAFAVRPATT